MANPSTVWAQLAIPNPANGSIPFVSSDGITIVTDVLHFSYDGTSLNLAYKLKLGYSQIALGATTVTCNSTTGRVSLPAGQSVLTVNNSQITANSMVFTQVESQDATATFVKSVAVNPTLQTVTITMNAAATAAVNLAFLLVN